MVDYVVSVLEGVYDNFYRKQHGVQWDSQLGVVDIGDCGIWDNHLYYFNELHLKNLIKSLGKRWNNVQMCDSAVP